MVSITFPRKNGADMVTELEITKKPTAAVRTVRRSFARYFAQVDI